MNVSVGVGWWGWQWDVYFVIVCELFFFGGLVEFFQYDGQVGYFYCYVGCVSVFFGYVDFGLFVVFGGQYGVGDGQVEIQVDVGDVGIGFVGDQLEVIGFVMDYGIQGDQGIELFGFGYFLQCQGDFQGIWYGYVQDVFVGYVEVFQFSQVGGQQVVVDVFVEVCLDDIDV